MCFTKIVKDQFMEAKVINDIPLSDIDDDDFNRKPIVNTVVGVINNLCLNYGENCFNIGIFGKWGEGKTSVLNFIKEGLRSLSNNTVIEFNPWFFKDDESLYLDFFSTISSASSDDRFVGAIKKYAPIVSLGLSGLSKVAALVNPVAEAITKKAANVVDAVSGINNNKSVSELKKEIDEIIRDSKKHYVIFIDDLDRLDKCELHSVLNLIKHTANFYNTIYVVAMDKDMVARSLNTEYDEDDNKNSGYDFLEKIFQLQIELPKIPSYRLYNYLMKRITPLFKQCSLSNEDIEAIKMDCGQVIEPAIDTARESILISNVLCVYLPLVCKDVYVPDFCLLQALKVLSPAMYQMIRNNKSRLVSDEKIVVTPSNAYHDKESFYEEQKQNPCYDQRYDNIIKRLLGFPPFNEKETSRSLCTEFFDRYFVYEIAEKSPKTEDIENLSKQIINGDTNTAVDAMTAIYGSYGEWGLKIAVHWIASEGSTLQKSPEKLILLANAIANFYKSHYPDIIVLDELPVRWDMEIVRLLNMIRESKGNVEIIMGELKNLYKESSRNFYVSILLCYNRSGAYRETKEYEGLIASFMVGMVPVHQESGFLFKINSCAIRLFYPIFKDNFPKEFNKMTSILYDPKALYYLLLIVKAFFGTIQTDEELEQSYRLFEKLFNVDKIYEVCGNYTVTEYIFTHQEIKSDVDQFKKMYSKYKVLKAD
jgi:hypothetical protein